ncbi:Protein of unknown function [Gryllus bimaculatus]|nr:Protein of unknown function [Gryllus bimaculatus]
MRKLQSRARRFTWTQWLSSPRETSWCLLDQLAIFAFPAAFLLFNVVYWSTYLQFIQHKKIEIAVTGK